MKTRRPAVWGAALSLALAAAPVLAQPVALAQSSAGVRARLKSIQAQIQHEQQLKALHQAQSSAAYGAFKRAASALDQAQARLNSIGQEMASLSAQEATAQTQLTAARRTEQTARHRLQATEIGWQEEGALGPLAVLLGSRSIDAFFSRLYLVNRVIGYQGSEVRTLAHAVAAVDSQTRILRAKEKAIAAEEASAQSAASSIQRQGQAERAAMAHDQALVQADSGALEQLEEASANLVRVLEEQHHASTVAPSRVGMSLHNIRFQWPVTGPITSPFGMRMDPVMHKYWLHTGVDIGVPEGTPVHAACGGTILYAGWMTGYGNVVIIDCGQGISTLYAHAQSLFVHAGQTVTQGQEIDLAGMTGWATGPHVHFEIRVNGTPINPLPYLPGG